jgi:hypothetical protein
VELMQPTLIARPFHRDGWVYEQKGNGYRMLAYKDSDRVRLICRQARTTPAVSLSWPPRSQALRFRTLISLTARWPSTTNSSSLASRGCTGGRKTRRRPQRSTWCSRFLLPARRLADEGLTAWAEVLECGYEGLVPKDPASPYVGGRTLKWLKVKQPKYREGERGWESKDKS